MSAAVSPDILVAGRTAAIAAGDRDAMATQEELDRLKAVVPAAQLSQRLYGVPASVTLAQWITESSWGTSELAVKANNCFGVKHPDKADAESYVEMPTCEYEGGKKVIVQAEFVRYASVADSFKAHAQLLAHSLRYAPAMAQAGNPPVFVGSLQTCGYSTNPKYGADLRVLMRLYKLTNYDVPQASLAPASVAT